MKVAIIGIANCLYPIKKILGLLNISEKFCSRGNVQVWLLGNGLIDRQKIDTMQCSKVVWFNNSALDSNEPHCFLEILKEIYEKERPNVLLFPAGILGNELAVIMGLILNSGSILDANDAEITDNRIVLKKAVYSNNLNAEFEMTVFPVIISFYASAEPDAESCTKTNVEIINKSYDCAPPEWMLQIEDELTAKENGMRATDTILVAGKGMGSKQNIKKIESLACLLKGFVGGTRPVTCDGWLPLDRMIGISSMLLSPKLCIVFGASGSAPFMVGVENSGLLVAVNNDPDALIFRACDVGIMDDCVEIADALVDILNSNRSFI